MRAIVVLFVLALGAHTVAAQPANVPDLIKLIENQPNDMDRSTWKEKRRDAARKLAQSKDKRGVPVLMSLAESETFDIIGEIAIEGLGTIGDKSAVPTLQGIVADTSRDKTSRDLAKKALAKLGAPEVAPAGGGTTGGTTGGGAKTGGTGTTGGTTGTTGGTTGGTVGVGVGGGAKTGTGGGAKTGGTTGGTATGGGTGGGAAGGGATGGGATGGGATGGGATGGGATGGGATGGGTTGGGTTVATGGTETGSGLETGGGGTDIGATGSGLLGEKQTTAIEGAPEFDDDVIAATNRLTFAIGSVGLRMQKVPADDAPPEQTPDKRVDFDADVAAYYQRRLDTETKAFRIDANAHLVAGWVNPEGRAQSRAVLFNLNGSGEGRFYSNKLYGIGKAAAAFAMTYTGYVHPTDMNQDAKNTISQIDVQIALGGGYGRIVDVGGAIRVRRLGRMLDAARALGKPIDDATSRKLQSTWWALRGERSSFRSLIATIAILREAGILLGEPNAVITYEILTVLRDTQLYARPSGLDAQLVIGEGFLRRRDDPNSDPNDPDCILPSCGRVEQVIATVGYAAQMDDDKMEVSVDGYARYRLFAPDDPATPSPWAAGAGGRMRRFTYGEHGDPFGALDLAGRLRVSSDGYDDMMMPTASDKTLRLEAEAGFTYWMNQASGLRLAAQLAMDQGTLYLGARLEGTYGLLDAIYAR